MYSNDKKNSLKRLISSRSDFAPLQYRSPQPNPLQVSVIRLVIQGVIHRDLSRDSP